jgi:diguanylate cyclase (GGDEF)-like protein
MSITGGGNADAAATNAAPAVLARGYALPLRLYVAGVVIVGWTAFLCLLGRAILEGSPARLTEFLMLAGLLIVSEQYPVSIQRRGGLDNVSLSGIFACALVLQWPVGWVLLVQVAASLIDDLSSRRQWWKSLFNAGQYSVALVAAAFVVHVVGYGRAGVPQGAQIAGALAAGFTYFLVNNLLTGTALARASNEPVFAFLLSDAQFQISVNGAMTVLTPVLIAAARQSVWLVPLLLVPAVAVYRGAHISLEKEHRARHDRLTELPNRFYFTEAVAEEIRHVSKQRALAVMVMDLDSFKELNDTLGHASGDDLLRQIGPRLTAALPAGSVLARLGGDEFAVLLPDISDVEEALRHAGALQQSLAASFEVEGISLDVHASVGVAIYPEHGDAPEILLQHADIAMYVAKRNRSGVEVYAAERNQHTRRRLAVLNELRPAIARGEISLHYQPQVDMRTGRATGVEALLRWNHPELGMVSPGEFIPLAEHSGYIRHLTDFVLAEAIAQLRKWRAVGIDVPIAVNVSPQVLREPELLRRLIDAVRDSELPAGALVVELTESAVMADPSHSRQLLTELADAGIRLSIDDFGTGYSALSYLSQLPVAELKIDRSFVTHIDSNESNRFIVEAITSLAKNLGIHVVAEGIERVAEWQTLAGLGAGVAQGFLVSRAVPADDMTAMLLSGEPLIETFAVTFGVDPATEHAPQAS